MNESLELYFWKCFLSLEILSEMFEKASLVWQSGDCRQSITILLTDGYFYVFKQLQAEEVQISLRWR